jgi:hypothetical protein
MFRSLFCIAIASLAMVFLGCDSGPTMVKVSGVVTVDGKPLRYGQIQVAPKGYRPAYAKLDSEGRFSLNTNEDGDGVPLGTHAVAVIGSEAKGAGAVYWHAPKYYADIATAGLSLTVEKETKDAKIEISWGTEKPFLEKFSTPKE